MKMTVMFKKFLQKKPWTKSAKKIKKLKQNIVELKEEMSEMRKSMDVLQNQNQQILQLLLTSSKLPVVDTE